MRLTRGLKERVRAAAHRAIQPFLAKALILENPYVSAKLRPLQQDDAYSIERRPGPDVPRGGPGSLPIPPQELWEGAGYGRTTGEYLGIGQSHVSVMLDVLQAAGRSPRELARVMDFGCAAGRMLRFYPYVEGHSELWGVDVSAKHISWCQRFLSPPFLFTTTTTAPHLPFEDNYFDLVYSGSVFTHITDLADTWLLELRRIVRRGGCIVIG